jgi:hypothetical protein
MEILIESTVCGKRIHHRKRVLTLSFALDKTETACSLKFRNRPDESQSGEFAFDEGVLKTSPTLSMPWSNAASLFGNQEDSRDGSHIAKSKRFLGPTQKSFGLIRHMWPPVARDPHFNGIVSHDTHSIESVSKTENS